MSSDQTSNPENDQTDEETREHPVSSAGDIAQEHGTSPLAGISGPEDFEGGKLGHASSPAETADSGTGWNATGPVDEVGHENAVETTDESTNRDDRSE